MTRLLLSKPDYRSPGTCPRQYILPWRVQYALAPTACIAILIHHLAASPSTVRDVQSNLDIRRRALLDRAGEQFMESRNLLTGDRYWIWAQQSCCKSRLGHGELMAGHVQALDEGLQYRGGDTTLLPRHVQRSTSGQSSAGRTLNMTRRRSLITMPA